MLAGIRRFVFVSLVIIFKFFFRALAIVFDLVNSDSQRFFVETINAQAVMAHLELVLIFEIVRRSLTVVTLVFLKADHAHFIDTLNLLVFVHVVDFPSEHGVLFVVDDDLVVQGTRVVAAVNQLVETTSMDSMFVGTFHSNFWDY